MKDNNLDLEPLFRGNCEANSDVFIERTVHIVYFQATSSYV